MSRVALWGIIALCAAVVLAQGYAISDCERRGGTPVRGAIQSVVCIQAGKPQ